MDLGPSTEKKEWPGLSINHVSLADANLFFLYMINDSLVGEGPLFEATVRFINDIAPNPEHVWEFIAKAHTLDEWMSKKTDYGLVTGKGSDGMTDRLHQRVYRIASVVQEKYGGDPRSIWASDSPGVFAHPEVVAGRLLNELICGNHASYMVLAALQDKGIIGSCHTDLWELVVNVP